MGGALGIWSFKCGEDEKIQRLRVCLHYVDRLSFSFVFSVSHSKEQQQMKLQSMAVQTKNAKQMADPVFTDADEDLKGTGERRDYSGAVEKTDPAEIALVRKLDWWIMPILWLMYWLNYLVSTSVLVELYI